MAAPLALLTLALTGCGGPAGASGGANGPTLTTGPVTIATDHSAYANSDSIKVTIANHRSTPIYAYDTKASCSILSLEVQQGGQWLPANALHCPLGRVALAVKIDAGGAYQTTIGATIMTIGAATPLADGTYRLALEYFDAPFGASATPPTSTVIYSATLTVSGSA
jgi:hypothetical protein